VPPAGFEFHLPVQTQFAVFEFVAQRSAHMAHEKTHKDTDNFLVTVGLLNTQTN
jgi:hypothetical protein